VVTKAFVGIQYYNSDIEGVSMEWADTLVFGLLVIYRLAAEYFQMKVITGADIRSKNVLLFPVYSVYLTT
jgi:hypothetical protein